MSSTDTAANNRERGSYSATPAADIERRLLSQAVAPEGTGAVDSPDLGVELDVGPSVDDGSDDESICTGMNFPNENDRRA